MERAGGLLEHVLVHYRWVFVLFLLPISLVYDLGLYLRNWYVFKCSSAPKKHSEKVRHVQRQILEWIKSGRKAKMCTARPGWQTVCFRIPAYKNSSYKIDVNLVDILDIDKKTPSVKVEPLVTMGQLTATLKPLGWTIPVLPEMDDLTVGGLVMGTGIESTSHKSGLFQHICLSYELVLCDGSVVKCSKNDNPDLYYSVPWSYGTLGILTAVELKLIPATNYVKLTYHPIRNLEDICGRFTSASYDDQNDFVEGIMFDKNNGVVMTGNFVDSCEENKVNAIGKWHKPWFFRHVESMLGQVGPVTEYIPLRDYYHRHTRSIFWELQDIIPFGNNVVFRYLFGWLVPPKVSLLKLTQTESIKKLYEQNHVIQDMLVPMARLKESVLKFHDVFQVYPLWLCPFVLAPNPGMIHPSSSKIEMYVDIGVYGAPKAADFQPRASTRAIEKYVMDVRGFQMLYADTYTTRAEFRKMFDHTLYDSMRAKLDCASAFPEVYDKVSKAARI